MSTLYVATSYAALATSLYAFYCALRSGPSLSIAAANAVLVFINLSLQAMRP